MLDSTTTIATTPPRAWRVLLALINLLPAAKRAQIVRLESTATVSLQLLPLFVKIVQLYLNLTLVLMMSPIVCVHLGAQEQTVDRVHIAPRVHSKTVLGQNLAWIVRNTMLAMLVVVQEDPDVEDF